MGKTCGSERLSRHYLSGQNAFSCKHVEFGMPPLIQQGDHILHDLSLCQHFEHFVTEYPIEGFGVDRRRSIFFWVFSLTFRERDPDIWVEFRYRAIHENRIPAKQPDHQLLREFLRAKLNDSVSEKRSATSIFPSPRANEEIEQMILRAIYRR